MVKNSEMDKIESNLKNIILNVLQIDDINYEDNIETVDMWDSMMHMELMVAIENKYSLHIEPEEIVALTSIRAIQKFLESRGVL